MWLITNCERLKSNMRSQKAFEKVALPLNEDQLTSGTLIALTLIIIELVDCISSENTLSIVTGNPDLIWWRLNRAPNDIQAF